MRKILLALAPAVALVLAPGLAAAEADTQAAVDPLVGLWASELRYGPALRGELILRRSGSEWEAGIGAIRHRFRAEDGALRFTLPDRAGSFRGRLSGDGRTISGFWIQPSGESEDRRDPGRRRPVLRDADITVAGGPEPMARRGRAARGPLHGLYQHRARGGRPRRRAPQPAIQFHRRHLPLPGDSRPAIRSASSSATKAATSAMRRPCCATPTGSASPGRTSARRSS